MSHTGCIMTGANMRMQMTYDRSLPLCLSNSRLPRESKPSVLPTPLPRPPRPPLAPPRPRNGLSLTDLRRDSVAVRCQSYLIKWFHFFGFSYSINGLSWRQKKVIWNPYQILLKYWCNRISNQAFLPHCGAYSKVMDYLKITVFVLSIGCWLNVEIWELRTKLEADDWSFRGRVYTE